MIPAAPPRPLSRKRGKGDALPDRRGVLNAAVIPELVQPAGNPKLRIGADVAIEHFGVVADRSNGARRPVLGEAQRLAEVPLRSDQPLDRRLLRLQRIVDGLRTDAEL